MLGLTLLRLDYHTRDEGWVVMCCSGILTTETCTAIRQIKLEPDVSARLMCAMAKTRLKSLLM